MKSHVQRGEACHRERHPGGGEGEDRRLRCHRGPQGHLSQRRSGNVRIELGCLIDELSTEKWAVAKDAGSAHAKSEEHKQAASPEGG